MNRGSFMPWDLVKETRGMLPAYFACWGLLLMGAFDVPYLSRLSLPAYFVGVAGLGAFSVGQEYAYHTLPMLLGQAVSRRRLFVIKWGTLAWMLATLTMASPVLWDRSEFETPALAVLPVLCGLCLAPWLTMVCRSTIAGAVFCFALPGLVFTTIQVLVLWTTGATLDETVTTSLLLWQTSAVCAIGAVMSYRTFMRLEAMEGTPDLQLASWAAWPRARSGVSRQHPLWMLIKKELGLQQISLAIGVLYVAGSAATIAFGHLYSLSLEIFSVLTVMHCTLTAVVIGALASAEERQLGTHEWQALMPVSTGIQWIVKVATVFGLTLGLSFLLPAVLVPLVDPSLDAGRLFGWQYALGAAMLAAGGLHSSSMSTSGIRALLLFFAAGFLVVLPTSLASQISTRAAADRPIDWLRRFIDIGLDRVGVVSSGSRSSAITAAAVVLFGILIATLLYYGYRNHRSADGASEPKWAQLALIGSGASIAVLLVVAATLP